MGVFRDGCRFGCTLAFPGWHWDSVGRVLERRNTVHSGLGIKKAITKVDDLDVLRVALIGMTLDYDTIAILFPPFDHDDVVAKPSLGLAYFWI